MGGAERNRLVILERFRLIKYYLIRNFFMGVIIMNYSKLPNHSAKRSFSKFKKWSGKEEDSQEDDMSEEELSDDAELEDFRNLLRELLAECRNLNGQLQLFQGALTTKKEDH